MMIKKFKKLLRIVKIDILIYSMRYDTLETFPNIGFKIETTPDSLPKKQYFIKEQGVVVHSSFLYPKLRVLRLIGKKGPAIGDCVTIPEYKGRSIYPYVINTIATQVLEAKEAPEVFIIVNSDNTSSIRGIEKAGFRLFKKIQAKRFLLFYFQIKIQ